MFWTNQNETSYDLVRLVACFPALPFSDARSLDLHFPTLSTYMFSWAYTQDIFFPRFPLVTYFPALSIGYIFSCAFHWLHIFSRFPLVTCFPTLSTAHMFSRAFQWLHIFPRFATGCDFVIGSWRCFRARALRFGSASVMRKPPIKSSLLSWFLAKLATS